MNDSHILRFTNTAELPEELKMGIDYIIGAQATLKSIEKKDNNDGSFTYVYKMGITEVHISNPVGKSVPVVAKSAKSESKKTRDQFFMIHRDNNIAMDFEEWYSKAMQYERVHREKNLEGSGLL